MEKIRVIISNRQKAVKIPTGVRMLIRRCCHAVLQLEDFQDSAEISVSFVDNDQIREMNQQYRDKDAAVSYTHLVFLVSAATGRYYNFNGLDRVLVKGDPENAWYYDCLLYTSRNTLIIAIAAAVASTVLGTMAAIGINSMKKLPRRIMMNVTNFPMVNPEIVTGVSLMLLFVFAVGLFGGRSLGMGSLIAAHITFCLPLSLIHI